MARKRDLQRQEILDRLPKGGVGAEIGVWEGGFSERLLEVAQPVQLHLIDPWEYQPDFDNTAFGRSVNETRMEEKYAGVCAKFADDPRVIIHRAYSHRVLESLPQASLDWVYIDGNHNYEVVARDLELSLGRLKPGGVIAGDDLLWNHDSGAPVQRAVRAFRRNLADAAEYHRFGQQWLFRFAA